MEAAPVGPGAAMDVDKLTYEIFSILESKFLFGYDDPKLLFASGSPHTPVAAAAKETPARVQAGKVCILSIDGGGRAADGLLAGAALVRLEASLRRRTGDPKARLADFFDVAAGSGAGGVLASMLVARGKDDARPLYSAEDALAFLVRSLRRGWSSPSGSLRALLRRPAGGAAFPCRCCVGAPSELQWSFAGAVGAALEPRWSCNGASSEPSVLSWSLRRGCNGVWPDVVDATNGATTKLLPNAILLR